MSQRNEIQISEILEVWESWNGWYWFVTEYHGGGLAFGLVRGWEIEWGYFNRPALRAGGDCEVGTMQKKGDGNRPELC